jgi:hypothetical protein
LRVTVVTIFMTPAGRVVPARAHRLAALALVCLGGVGHLLLGELAEGVGDFVLAGMTAVLVDQRGRSRLVP